MIMVEVKPLHENTVTIATIRGGGRTIFGGRKFIKQTEKKLENFCGGRKNLKKKILCRKKNLRSKFFGVVENRHSNALTDE